MINDTKSGVSKEKDIHSLNARGNQQTPEPLRIFNEAAAITKRLGGALFYA